jgi:hypothetical protein
MVPLANFVKCCELLVVMLQGLNRPFVLQTHVRVYNLAKQQLAKKLTAGVNQISSMAIHPGGERRCFPASLLRL